ncbi:MAG: hypothetical protein ACREBW_08015 [Candidatus Micrarchaeaceae archaeon]
MLQNSQSDGQMGKIGIVDTVSGSSTIFKYNIKAAWPLVVLTIITAVLAFALANSASSALVGLMSPSSLGGLQPAAPTTNLLPLLLGLVALGIISLFVGPLLNGFYISGANDLASIKGTIGMSKAFATAKRRYWSLFGANILSSFIFLVALAIPIAIFIAAILGLVAASSSGLPSLGAAASGLGLLSLGIVIMIVISIILVPLLFLSQAVVITEGRSAVAAIMRSFEIGRQVFWKLLGIALLIGLITFGINVIAGIIYGITGLFAPLAGTVLQQILEIGTSVFIGLITIFAQVLAYKAYAGKRQAQQ